MQYLDLNKNSIYMNLPMQQNYKGKFTTLLFILIPEQIMGVMSILSIGLLFFQVF